MKLPISNRLLACASFVRPGARVADIGTDHGYLGIHLLQEGIAAHVIAADLRESPLQNAVANARKHGTADRMEFRCCDGLSAVCADEIDTVVCAGMGADCIVDILTAASWLRNPTYRLILQPQSSGQALRGWLPRQGFEILRETLLEENRFLYTVLEARYTGNCREPAPGHQFVTPQLLACGSPMLNRYLDRLTGSMEKTIIGLEKGADEPEKLQFYRTALREITEMRDSL